MIYLSILSMGLLAWLLVVSFKQGRAKADRNEGLLFNGMPSEAMLRTILHEHHKNSGGGRVYYAISVPGYSVLNARVSDDGIEYMEHPKRSIETKGFESKYPAGSIGYYNDAARHIGNVLRGLHEAVIDAKSGRNPFTDQAGPGIALDCEAINRGVAERIKRAEIQNKFRALIKHKYAQGATLTIDFDRDARTLPEHIEMRNMIIDIQETAACGQKFCLTGNLKAQARFMAEYEELARGRKFLPGIYIETGLQREERIKKGMEEWLQKAKEDLNKGFKDMRDASDSMAYAMSSINLARADEKLRAAAKEEAFLEDWHNRNRTGVGLINQEREKQLYKHRFSLTHDQKYKEDELKLAAIYALIMEHCEDADEWFPPTWDDKFRESLEEKSPIERLITAGALIAAEIDRRITAGKE